MPESFESPQSRKQEKKELAHVETPQDVEEADSDVASSAYQTTWGTSDVAVWRQADTQASALSKGLINEINALDELQNNFLYLDIAPDGLLTRDELHTKAKESAHWGPAESHAVNHFGRLSRGNNGISKNDLERTILGDLTVLLEDARTKGRFSDETRSVIAQWGEKVCNQKQAQALQNQLNTALEGSGLQTKLEYSTRKNYLGQDYSFTTFTMQNGDREQDKFSFVSPSTVGRSLLRATAFDNGTAILNDVDPGRTYSPETIKDMQDLRALPYLMHSPHMADGGITFKEAAKNEKSFAEREHAHRHLQDNFAKLAMKDGDGNSVSKKDVQYAMEETLSSLIKKHLSRDGANRNALLDQFVKEALRDEYIGYSETFIKTLNAALDKEGYKASLSEQYIQNKVYPVPYERKLTIEDKLVPANRKDISVVLPNPVFKNSNKGINQTPIR